MIMKPWLGSVKLQIKGILSGQYYLGLMLMEGRGVPRDDNKALAWFRKAAGKGSFIGQYFVGLMYKEGRGVTRDDKEALAWFRKAAEKDSPPM